MLKASQGSLPAMRLTLALLLALAACGSDPDAPTTVDRGEVCDFLGLRICARGVACGLTKMDECFADGKTGCCTKAGKCREVGFRSSDEYRQWMAVCGPAIDAQACDQTLKVLPAMCLAGLN